MSNKVRRIFSKAVNLITSATAQGLSKGELGSPDTPEEMKSIARIAAEEGIVMLKNNGVLPIEKDENVCIFGRIQRDYFFVGYGSGGDVNKPYCVDLVDGMKNAGIKVDEQLEKIYSDWIKKNPADDGFWGAWPRYHDEMKIDEKTVADAAKRSSCAVVVIGRSAGEDRENTLKKGSYYLTDDETALLDKVTANFKNTVVLINSGNIIDMSWMNKYGDRLGAVLYVWQGGMESGNAIGEVLSGKASPSGKLPDTIADCYESYPAAKNFGKKTYNNYAEDIFVGYRYFETFAPEKVMFPFGFGLSYTTFEYSDLKVSADSIKDTDTLKVSFKIKNTGDRDGAEVAELYVAQENSTIFRPEKELKGFKKVFLKAGEEKEVEIELSKRAFAFYDVDLGDWHVETDDYKILVGASSRDIRLEGSVKVESTVDAPVKDLRETMPAYYSADVMNVPDDQFKALLGHEIPESEIHDYPNLTFANTLEDSACGKNGAKLCKMLRKFVGSEGMACSIALQTPVKNFVSMSMGVFSEELGRQLLDILNDKKPMGRGILVLIGKAIPAVVKGLPNLLKNI